MELACCVLQASLELYYYLRQVKINDEELCFLKWFGFTFDNFDGLEATFNFLFNFLKGQKKYVIVQKLRTCAFLVVDIAVICLFWRKQQFPPWFQVVKCIHFHLRGFQRFQRHFFYWGDATNYFRPSWSKKSEKKEGTF